MLNNLPLGIYIPGASVLHRLQARTKLLLMGWLAVLLFVANRQAWHLGPYIVTLALLLAAVALSNIRPGYIFRRMRLLVLLVILADIPALLFTPGDTTVATIGPFVISSDGAWFVLGFSTIFLFIFLASQLLALTTSPAALAEGLALLLRPLRSWRVPADELALMTLVSLRFLPLLVDEANQLIKAQQSRGAQFTQGSPRKRRRAILALIVPMLRGALRRAGELAVALESRGYAVAGEQTPLYETRLRKQDYAALALVMVPTLAALLI
ncbi:MAG TPA: energy-coupling factor transporter transmembrane component T [Ktedonobacterales bacterium]|nr:energy-coupling factor transporter transmembrane component T [Ktedonobacterales bacterium]